MQYHKYHFHVREIVRPQQGVYYRYISLTKVYNLLQGKAKLTWFYKKHGALTQHKMLVNN